MLFCFWKACLPNSFYRSFLLFVAFDKMLERHTFLARSCDFAIHIIYFNIFLPHKIYKEKKALQNESGEEVFHRNHKAYNARLPELYIEDITRWREDMNFILDWQNNILLTRCARS